MIKNSEIETNFISEPGKYPVTIESFEPDVLNEKDIVKFTLRTLDGSDRTYKETFWITAAALWRLKALSIACGINEDADWDYPDLVGKKLSIYLKANGEGYLSATKFERQEGGDPF